MPSVYGDSEIIAMAKAYVRARKRVESKVLSLPDKRQDVMLNQMKRIDTQAVKVLQNFGKLVRAYENLEMKSVV